MSTDSKNSHTRPRESSEIYHLSLTLLPGISLKMFCVGVFVYRLRCVSVCVCVCCLSERVFVM